MYKATSVSAGNLPETPYSLALGTCLRPTKPYSLSVQNVEKTVALGTRSRMSDAVDSVLLVVNKEVERPFSEPPY